jgi:hypothetical protein
MDFLLELAEDVLDGEMSTNGILPVRFIEAPSTKVSRASSITGVFDWSELYIEGDPRGSKPTSFTSGAIWLR